MLFGDVSGKIALRARLVCLGLPLPQRIAGGWCSQCACEPFRHVRLYHPYRSVETKNSVPRRTTKVIRSSDGTPYHRVLGILFYRPRELIFNSERRS